MNYKYNNMEKMNKNKLNMKRQQKDDNDYYYNDQINENENDMNRMNKNENNADYDEEYQNTRGKNKTHNFKVEDVYHNYDKEKNKKEINIKNKIINIPLNSNNKNSIEYEIIESNNSMNIIKSMKFNNERITNINKNNNNGINKIKKKNKIKNSENPNLIIKYAFLNNAINKIIRKVDFINPKNGDQIKLFTANVNNNKKEEKKREDFTTYGYEMTPEELYKLYQKYVYYIPQMKINTKIVN